MKKADVNLILTVLILAIISLVLYQLLSKADASYVVIKMDGKLYRKLPLNIDDTIRINKGTFKNVIEIKNRRVQMISANCPDLICVKQTPISLGGQTIICLPHKIIIETTNSEQPELDTVTIKEKY